VNAHDVPLHDILDTGIDICKENRCLESELVEGKIDTLVGVSAPGSYGTLHSGGALERRVSNGGADRVHIRIAMAYNEGFHI
jgi:hypothetical protein